MNPSIQTGQAHLLRSPEHVLQELRSVGVTSWGLGHAACHSLQRIMHADEHVLGAVYGYRNTVFALLAATDRRVLYINKWLLVTNKDEVSYEVVFGVTHNQSMFGTTITLHTYIATYSIFTFNSSCAERFVQYIESRCLEHRMSQQTLDMRSLQHPVDQRNYP